MISAKRIKLGPHATYAVYLEGWKADSAIVLVLGAELGDKPIFDLGKPISAALLQGAAELAALAGVRVPVIYDAGELWRRCDGTDETFQFVIQERIASAASAADGNGAVVPTGEVEIAAEHLLAKLGARPVSIGESASVPWFATRAQFLASLQYLTTDHRVHQALAVLLDNENAAHKRRPHPLEPQPVLVHQDLRSNLLMSPADGSGSGRDRWDLDAVIGWECACAFDPSVGESMPLLGALASVVKGAWLAERIVSQDGEAPRCELHRIRSEYERGRRHLSDVGVAVVPFSECFRTMDPPPSIQAADAQPGFPGWVYAAALVAVLTAALHASGLV